MKNTIRCPRVGLTRRRLLLVSRRQDRATAGGMPVAGAQAGAARARTAARRAPAGPDAQRAGRAQPGRLDLSIGHFRTHTGHFGLERDVNLLSLTHGDPDNHGAAARAAQVRSGVVRCIARDFAECFDGRRTSGLPGWAYRISLPACALTFDSVTRHGICPGRPPGQGRELQAPQKSECALPLRSSKLRRSPASLEAVPRKGLSAFEHLGKGVPHG